MDLNNRAVDVGLTGMTKVEVPAAWADAKDGAPEELKGTDFVKEIVVPMDRQHGDKLPVSLFKRHNCLDGTWENGTTAYSKRGRGRHGAPVESPTRASSATAVPWRVPTRPSGPCC